MASRKLIVEIIGDSRSLERAFGRSSSASKRFGRDMSQAGRGAIAVSGLFSGLGRSVAFASGAFLGGAGLLKVTKDSVAAASNLAEQTNKVNVIFGESADTITAWGKTTAEAIGIANDEALTAAGTFGNLFRTVGLTTDKNAALSKSLVQLAADLASFNNADPSEVLDALRSGLVGEAEPLRRFGILLSESRVQQEAMRESGVKNVKQLTAQQKLIARYTLILRDSKVAQGDFARTADSQANAARSLSAAIRDTEAAIGKALLPVVNDITIKLRDWLGDEKNQKRIQEDVTTAVEGTASAVAFLAAGFEKAAAAVNVYNDAVSQLPGGKGAFGLGALIEHALLGPFAAPKELLDIIKQGGSGNKALADALNKARVRTGEDVAARGATSRRDSTPRGAAAAAKRAAAQAQQGVSLVARIARAELAVAKAALTKSRADDRAALVAEKALLQEAIDSHKKKFRDKLKLTRDLANIISQIQSIDDEANQKRIDAQEKAAAAAKKARDKERAARKKAHDAAVAAAKDAKEAAREATRDFRDLINTERDRIGELFGGPLFNPSEAQRKAALGAPTPGSNVKTLVADLKAQIQQFKNFQRDLATLAKRGAPPQLLAELRQGGLAVAPQVHALATAGAGTFAQFKSLFIQRERLAVQAAKQERPVINLTVIVNKDTGHVSVKTTPHGQKRGRNAGIVINQGRVLPG